MIKLLDILDCELLIKEGYEYVVRNRKKVKRLERKAGYKIVNGKYVKMLADEVNNRRKAQRKARHSSKRSTKKRRLSLIKRRSLGLKRR